MIHADHRTGPLGEAVAFRDQRVFSLMGSDGAAWQSCGMPVADTVLLPLTVGLALLGLLITVVAARRGRRGRAVQGVGLALAPVALYFSGLLRLLWDGVVAIGTWAGRVILSPSVWFGLSLLGVCVVLWVIGGFIARRSPKRVRGPKAAQPAVAARPSTGSGNGKTSSGPSTGSGNGKTSAAPPVDDDMAEIEAMLKSRGID